MGRPLLHEPDSEEAERARANLKHIGVTVDVEGKIELSDEAIHILKHAPWILKDEEANNPAEQSHGPAQRTLSRIMRILAKIEAAERWAHSNEREKERRPEAGCPRNLWNMERTTGRHSHAKRTLESGNTSEDWMHQHSTEHQMQAQDKWRFIVRSNI